MTTFTPNGFVKAMTHLVKLQDSLPTQALKQSIEASKATLVAASAASGGISAKESEFRDRWVRRSPGYADATIRGRGFAVLDEFGSYKSPKGYAIAPKKFGKRQTNSKRASFETRARSAARSLGYSRVMLGNPATGFAAAYVTNHPPIKAHPYVGAAERIIGDIVERAATAEQLTAIAKALG